MGQFVRKQLTPHPVPKKKDVRDGEWQKVVIPPVLLYEAKESAGEFFSSPVGLNCFPTVPALPCDFCSSNNALEELTDPCLISIIHKNITYPLCDAVPSEPADTMQEIFVEEVVTAAPGEVSTTVKFTNTELIVTNDEPSAIMEQCKNEFGQMTSEQIHLLPPAVRIIIKHGCKPRFINKPKVKGVNPNHEYENVDMQLPVAPATGSEFSNKVANQIDGLRVHFEHNGIIYIISTTSIFGSIFLFLLIFCATRFIQHRRRTRRRIITIDNTTGERFSMPMLPYSKSTQVV
jgi:hypothetical protein